MPKAMAEFEGCEATQESDAALLVLIDGNEVWIPKSQLSDESEIQEKGDKGLLVIPEWLAIEKELV